METCSLGDTFLHERKLGFSAVFPGLPCWWVSLLPLTVPPQGIYLVKVEINQANNLLA